MYAKSDAVKTFFVLLFFPQIIYGIWPPAYKINLTQSGTFVISEEFGSDDYDDILDSEDEMIKEKDLEVFKLDKDSKKYFGIHQLVKNRNKRVQTNNFPEDVKNAAILKESIFEQEDPIPWEAGFVDRNGNLIQPVRSQNFKMYLNFYLLF